MSFDWFSGLDQGDTSFDGICYGRGAEGRKNNLKELTSSGNDQHLMNEWETLNQTPKQISFIHKRIRRTGRTLCIKNKEQL